MEKNILSVAFDDSDNTYKVNIAQGTSVPEIAFTSSVVAKCLARDGYIKTTDEFLSLVKKYLTDPQFDEVTDETNSSENS